MLRNRLILAALWILSLVGISFYGGPVTYGFFAVMTLIPVILLIYLLLVLARFKIYQHFESKDIVSDHKIPFYFTLQNEDYFAFCAVRVRFYSDFSVIDGLSDDNEYELLPQSKIKKETGLVCKYRGEYNVGIKSVTLRDFLCVFKLTYKNREALRVRVLPNIIRLSALKSVDVESISDRETTVNASYPDVTVREYIAGDDSRRINWKQTAKVGKPMVRNYIGEEKNGVGLIIDPFRISKKETEYLPIENRMLEAAVALTLFMEEKHIPVSVYGYSDSVRESAVDSADSFNDFYKAASSFSFSEETDRTDMLGKLSKTQSIYDKKTVFLITADVTPSMYEFAKGLNRSDTEVIVYLVKNNDEGTLPVSPFVHTKVVTVPTEKSLEEVI